MSFIPVIARSHMAASTDLVERNVRLSLKRGLPELDQSAAWGKFKGDAPLALVGGGPSLVSTIEELRTFRHIVACGSVHDHLIEEGIEPEYCIVCDPDRVAADHLTKPCPTTHYLIASHCDPEVFDRLARVPVTIWHSASGLDPSIYNGRGVVGGGCTVTLRAMIVFLHMGWGNQHFFGFDSCLAGDVHHAYHHPAFEDENEDEPIEIRMLGSDKVFRSLPYHLAQAQQFQDAIAKHAKVITPTIHGDGLIAEIMRLGAVQAAAESAAA